MPEMCHRILADAVITISKSLSSPLLLSLPLSSRKFMVEISDTGEVVQVFEFSDNGAPPPGQGDAGGSSNRQEAIIEKIRGRYSGSGTGSDGDEPRGDDGRRGRSSASRSHSSARKIVVESDGRDNLVRAIELPSDGGGLCGGDDATPRAPRDESPFSKRDMGRKEEVEGREKPPEKARERRSVSFLLDDDREEALGANDDRSDVSEESSPSRGAGNASSMTTLVARSRLLPRPGPSPPWTPARGATSPAGPPVGPSASLWTSPTI